MIQKQIKEYEQQLQNQGYFVLKLEQLQKLTETKEQLLNELKRITQRADITLENYHTLNFSDQEHLEFQNTISNFFKDSKFARGILEENLEIFNKIVGVNLDVQSKPYLRIARPGKFCDNIGYHRDTFYGGYPEELSIVIPFVDLNEDASLSMCPGSHILSENDFEFDQKQLEDKNEFKKSIKHGLGFLYAPKQLKNEDKYDIRPIPLKYGEVLVFMLSTLHGSVINKSKTTRWSTDVRLKNALSTIDLSSRPTYYEELCRSALYTCCSKFMKNNKMNRNQDALK